MKQLVEYLKQQALEKDRELGLRDKEILKIQQASELKLRAARQERSQMTEAILGMQAQLEEKDRLAAVHQEAVKGYEAQIANLIESNLECNELKAQVRELE